MGCRDENRCRRKIQACIQLHFIEHIYAEHSKNIRFAFQEANKFVKLSIDILTDCLPLNYHKNYGNYVMLVIK